MAATKAEPNQLASVHRFTGKERNLKARPAGLIHWEFSNNGWSKQEDTVCVSNSVSSLEKELLYLQSTLKIKIKTSWDSISQVSNGFLFCCQIWKHRFHFLPFQPWLSTISIFLCSSERCWSKEVVLPLTFPQGYFRNRRPIKQADISVMFSWRCYVSSEHQCSPTTSQVAVKWFTVPELWSLDDEHFALNVALTLPFVQMTSVLFSESILLYSIGRRARIWIL